MYTMRMRYAAFIRGVGPENPNTKNDKLKALFESLGFTDVVPFISSGNVMFSSGMRSADKLESMIEKAMAARLDFNKDVFVRSADELLALVQKDPFKGASHGGKTYLLVTFIRTEPREAFTAIDMAKSDGQKAMAEIEKKYGKEATSRTWNTVCRMLAKMQKAPSAIRPR